MANRNIYSVAQVNSYIKNMFAQDFMLRQVSIKGEVSNCKYHTSGHIYFTIKDAGAAMYAIMFAGSRAAGLSFHMKEGDQVIVTGSVEVYEKTGAYHNTYIASGYSEADALAAVNTSLSQKASVSLLSGKNVTSHSGIYYCFSYLGWVLLVMMIAGIAPVLQVFSKKEIKERISCSSYKFANYNRELLLGVILTGLVVCAVIFASATIMFKGSTFSFSGFLFTLNMLCYMLVSLAFAFLISKITSNSEILNMFANTVSLGMAFLCGIFVPEEFLSDGIIKAAHFLPAYWYNQAVKSIDFHPVRELGFISICMGIQLLFAAAIIVVALRITKAPDGFKKHTAAVAAHK